MENFDSLSLSNNLTNNIDKQKILEAIIIQLEKDTGFDFTKEIIPDNLNLFIEKLHFELMNYLIKVSKQSQTKLMNLIYRVDINQRSFNKIKNNEKYFHTFTDMVLSRIFQKTITKIYYK
ncbi:MAG: hypothetical protein IT243_00835 [Bacteroidia bacterium]|nr:hypothetical protein [Bacteroidia bacterium]